MGTIWSPERISTEGPKYKAVASLIQNHIAEGSLKVGAKLPPVRDMAWQLQITPGTVARAYTILTDEGVLRAEVGRGTFVAEIQSERPLNLIEVDALPHTTGGDTDNVNLFSPHLPNAGQAGLIRQLLANIAQDPPSGVMHYPSRSSARGAREAFVGWLQGTPIGAFNQDDVVLTHGGQNAILLVYQTILKGRRPVIFLEELAYPGFRRAAELLRAEVVSIAMDIHGVIPDALAAAAERYPEGQLLCTSPEVHSPTCGFTPMSRRAEIVKVARRYDLQILEDDCYRMGRAEGEGYRQMAPERGWYISSLSKSITPALRVGCAIGPKGQNGALHRSAEHGFFGLAAPIIDLTQALLTHPKLPQITAASRSGVEEYVKIAVNRLGAYDLHWRRDVPFLWMHLPNGWRASAFCQAAETVGVRIRAAEEFAARNAQAPHAVRMAVNAGVSLRSFDAAMARLAQLLDNPADQIGV